MNKAREERLWYLRKYYARGGWHIAHLAGVKKWDDHLGKLIKDGEIEEDIANNLYRITDKGIAAVAEFSKQLSRQLG